MPVFLGPPVPAPGAPRYLGPPIREIPPVPRLLGPPISPYPGGEVGIEPPGFGKFPPLPRRAFPLRKRRRRAALMAAAQYGHHYPL